jgi:hypothetical protein
MTDATPQNDEESAYLAYVMADELINLFVKKNILSEDDRRSLFEIVVKRLLHNGSDSKQRAAAFLSQKIGMEREV